MSRATGDIILLQDADLEYDPADYPALIEPIVQGRSHVVYGRRRWDRQFAPGRPARWPYAAGNWLVTRLTNALYGTRLSDQSTGYKAFSREVAGRLRLTADGFDVCAEITAQVRKLGYEIVETPVDYRPRGAGEGKKIRAVDGLRVIRTLVRQRLRA
jgi:hypothetical protein